MLFGAHISASGGVANTPKNAKKIGCEIFQFFSRPPQGGKAPALTPAAIKSFQATMKKCGQKEAYIHTPYFINLASTNNRIRYGSIKVIREELERASLLGAKYVMTHLGSANDLPRGQAIKKVIEGIKKILDDYQGAALLLIENSAGAGNIIGDEFEEINEIIKGVPPPAHSALSSWPKGRDKLSVCFDTCHAFASGYDLRDKKSINETLNKFNKIIGLKRLKLIHINDSKAELGSHIDRHEHIGQGKIGLEGFRALIHYPLLKNINMVLETPDDKQGNQQNDLEIIKKLRE